MRNGDIVYLVQERDTHEMRREVISEILELLVLFAPLFLYLLLVSQQGKLGIQQLSMKTEQSETMLTSSQISINFHI